jgi:methyl-accepting chemotaxis protein
MTDILARFSIRVKLTAGFAAMLMMTGVLGLFTMQRMAAMNEQAEQVRTNYLPSLTQVAAMEKQINTIRIRQAITIMDPDVAERQANLAVITDRTAVYEKLRKAYDPMIAAGEEAEHYKSIDRVWQDFKALGARTVETANQGDGAKAFLTFTTEMRKNYTELTDLFDWDAEYNRSHGAAAADHVYGLYQTGRTVTVAAIACAALATLIFAYLLVRGIAGPIAGMTAAMRRLADRDMATEIPGIGRGDEIGAMATAVLVFKDSMIEADRLTTEQAAAREARAKRQDEMERATEAFGTSMASVLTRLGNSASGMRRSAEAMNQASTTVHEKASSTSSNAVKSSQDLTSAAAAVEELTSSFAEIARQVTTSADVSRQAVRRAQDGQETIRGLAESTARIGDVVGLISTIAAQTNLLALNATIEAARAGESGKGFAVVAGEVKALAAQTSKATAEISSQIDTVRGATEATVTAMGEIGGMIGRMDEVAAAMAAAVEEQTATTREIASSVHEVSDATARSAEAMGDVVTVSGEAGSAAQFVLTGASDVGNEATALRAEVEKFLKTVRGDAKERRRFERFDVGHVNAILRVPSTPGPVTVRIKDLSEAGASLRCPLPILSGTELSIELPNVSTAVPATVIRADSGTLGVEFATDADTRTQVKRGLEALLMRQAAA